MRLSPWAWLGILVLSFLMTASVIAAVLMWVPAGGFPFALPGGQSPSTANAPGQQLPGGFAMLPFGFERDKILLVMGVDVNYRNRDRNDFQGARTDTMMLVRVNPRQKTVSLVSIPRDSKVYLAGNRGVDKINAAHALGGPELALQTVEAAFGIPIDHYMVINFKGVRELVDALGGVTVTVEKPLRYHDYTAKLNINLKPGTQVLNGSAAEGYLRFRHDAMADIGRIRRQQRFVAAVAEKLKSPWVFPRLPSLVALGMQYVRTDMTPDALFKLAMVGKDVDLKTLRVATLPGHPSGGPVSYWIVDPGPAQALLDRLVLDTDGAASENTVTPASGNTSAWPARHAFRNEVLPAPAQAARLAPIRVGIVYAPTVRHRVAPLVAQLERQSGFKVTCQARQRSLDVAGVEPAVIVEHSHRVNDDITRQLREADARLQRARLIVAPIGATYESTACDGREDVTLFLGEA